MNLKKSCVVFTEIVPVEKIGEIVRCLGVKEARNTRVYRNSFILGKHKI